MRLLSELKMMTAKEISILNQKARCNWLQQGIQILSIFIIR